MIGLAAAQVGLGLIGGAAKFFQGRKMQRKAEEFINNFEWQPLSNVGNNMQVSTMGSDLRREESARMAASNVEALRGSGARGIIGGLDRVQSNNNLVNRESAADLDRQRFRIEQIKAQDEAHIRDMKEKRDADELAGYGNMLQQGLATKMGGVDTAINSLGMAGQALSGFGGFTPQVSSVGSSIQPSAATPLSGASSIGQVTLPTFNF